MKSVRPLDGVRVLAVENFTAGPLATTLLADWGADVVKVEPPAGDTIRSFPPIERRAGLRSNNLFSRLNRGKRSVLLDIREPAGADEFRRLAAAADVLLQNLKPGSLHRMGLGYETLSSANERLIMVSVSGYGQPDVMPGPYTDLPAFDSIGQAMSGLAYTTGGPDDPPAAIGFPLIDTATAHWAATATLLALRQRDITGRGQHVDIAMYDVGMHLNEYNFGLYGRTGQLPKRGRPPTSAPFEVFAARDGYVAIAVAGQAIFEKFAVAIEAPELIADPRMADGTRRSQAMDDVLKPIIEAWTGSRMVEEVLQIFARAGVPASRVQTVADLLTCPQVEARRMIAKVPDPLLGQVLTASHPVRGTGFTWPEPLAAPQLGEHTHAVFEDWTGRPSPAMT